MGIYVRKEQSIAQKDTPEKRQRLNELQKVGGRVYLPSFPHPIGSQRASAIPVPSSSESSSAFHASLWIASGNHILV